MYGVFEQWRLKPDQPVNPHSLISTSIFFHVSSIYWLCKQAKQVLIMLCTLRKHAYSNTLKISPQKTESFSDKNLDIFHISAQNIYCGYTLEPPRWGGSNEYPQSMFLSRNKKNNVYTCKTQFEYKKVGLRGSNLYRYFFVMIWAVVVRICNKGHFLTFRHDYSFYLHVFISHASIYMRKLSTHYIHVFTSHCFTCDYVILYLRMFTWVEYFNIFTCVFISRTLYCIYIYLHQSQAMIYISMQSIPLYC